MSTRYQIQAFVRQFPALFVAAEGEKPMVNADRVRDVRVARVTRELLETTPSSWEVAHRDGDYEDDDVWLLDAEHSPIGKVRSEWSHGSEVTRAGETIGEAIARLGVADLVASVLRRRTGYEVRCGEQVDKYDVTLYLAPKGWTVLAWIAEQQRRAAARLSSTVERIRDADVA